MRARQIRLACRSWNDTEIYRKNVQLWFIWYTNFLNRKIQAKNSYPAESYYTLYILCLEKMIWLLYIRKKQEIFGTKNW